MLLFLGHIVGDVPSNIFCASAICNEFDIVV